MGGKGSGRRKEYPGEVYQHECGYKASTRYCDECELVMADGTFTMVPCPHPWAGNDHKTKRYLEMGLLKPAKRSISVRPLDPETGKPLYWRKRCAVGLEGFWSKGPGTPICDDHKKLSPKARMKVHKAALAKEDS